MWEFPNEPGILSSEAGCLALKKWGIETGSIEASVSATHIFTHVEWNMAGISVSSEHLELPEGWLWADRRVLQQELAVPSAFRAYLTEVYKRI